MEVETRQRPINSKVLESIPVKKQIEILKNAIEDAQAAMDYESAHDKEVMKAIHVVEDFLRKSGRICYGGQAINAHLPLLLLCISLPWHLAGLVLYSLWATSRTRQSRNCSNYRTNQLLHHEVCNVPQNHHS